MATDIDTNWAQLVQVVDKKDLVVNTVTGSTLTSTYEPPVGTPYSSAFSEKVKHNGVNYSADILKEMSGIVYDDSTSYLKTPQQDLVQKITDRAVKDFHTGFFPTNAKYIYNNDPEINSKTSKNFTPIDVDNIMPVSPQGYSFLTTGNLHITPTTKNYTKAYLTAFELLVSKSPMMTQLMDMSTYFLHNNTNFGDRSNENEIQIQTNDVDAHVRAYLQKENTLQDLNLLFAKSVSGNIKRNVAVKSFARSLTPVELQTQLETKLVPGTTAYITLPISNETRKPVWNIGNTSIGSSSPDNSMTMYNYIGNATSFIHAHTMYSSQQRALLFEKDFGIRPFFHIGGVQKLVQDFKATDYNSKNKNGGIDGNATIASEDPVSIGITTTKPQGFQNNPGNNKFWSSYISDGFVDPKDGLQTDSFVNGSFIHIFQHRIDKIFGYCENLSVNEYSLIFDSSKDNASVIEQYISDFYQIAMVSKSNGNNGPKNRVKIVVILQPSVIMSELSQYVLFYQYVKLYRDLLGQISDDTGLMNIFNKLHDKFLKNDLSNFEKMVVHCRNNSSGESTTSLLSIDDISLSGESDFPFVQLFKKLSGDFSSTHLENNLQFLKFANKKSLHTWLADQKTKGATDDYWLYSWVYLMSTVLTNSVHNILESKLQTMAIPDCAIDVSTISYPVHINPIRTPVSAKVARFFSRMDKTLLSGYEACKIINDILTEDSEVSQQLRGIITNPRLYNERNVPLIAKNPKLNLTNILVGRLEANTLYQTTTAIDSDFKDDPRKHISKIITFELSPTVLETTTKDITDIVDFTNKQHSDGSLHTLTNLQAILKDDINEIVDLESNDPDRLKRTIKMVVAVKGLSDIFIARLSEIAEILLRVPTEEDIGEMRQLRGIDPKKNIKNENFATDLHNLMEQAKLLSGNIKNGINIDNSLELNMREILELDSLLRMNETRIIMGRRLCKIITVWKMPMKDLGIISQIWHTFTPKDKPVLESGGFLSGTPMGIHKADTMKEYIKSQKYSIADRKFSLLSDVMENFEDPLSNGDLFITETPDKLNSSNGILNSEKLSQHLSEVDQYIQEQKRIKDKSLANTISKYASYFTSPITNFYSKLTLSQSKQVDEETSTKNKPEQLVGGISIENIRQIHYDDIDWFIDTTTVCAFFKNCVILDHGYMSNEYTIYGLCKNEGSAMNYYFSVLDEFRSGNSSSIIISPFKGYLDRFYEEFRDTQNTPNNPFFNPRILLNRIRIDVDAKFFDGKNIQNTGNVIQTVMRDVLIDNVQVPAPTRICTTSLLQIVDVYNKGPEISFTSNIISVTESRLNTAIKWIKILGSLSTSIHITARLLDVNKSYTSPYNSPLYRRIGNGLPHFIKSNSKNDFKHPAYISSLLEFAWELINDGTTLLPTKYSLYMNPFYSFTGLLSNGIKDITLFDHAIKSNEPAKNNITSEKHAIELLGDVLLCRSVLVPNIIWIDPSSLLDITKIDDSGKQFVDWAMGMFSDTNRFLNFKLWNTVDYKTFSDLVPVSPLCAIKANKLYCRVRCDANHIPAKDKAYNNNTITHALPTNSTLQKISEQSQFVISPYDEDALIQRPGLTTNEFVNSSISIGGSFLADRSKEFNLRRTYFDLACTNISSLLKFGSIKRPLLNKRIWNNVVHRSSNFGSDSLASAVDLHIRSFLYNTQKEPAAEPQLYILHSRKMAASASIKRYTTNPVQEPMLMTAFYGQSLHTFTKRNVVDTLSMEYKSAIGGNQKLNVWNEGANVAANYIEKESVDLRFFIDASFSRQMRHYVEKMKDTTQRMDEKTVNVPQQNPYRGILSTAIDDVSKNYVVDRFNTGKNTANVPSNSWNSDSFPVVYQSITFGTFYYDLVGVQCQRKVSVPVYSLDSGDNSTMLVPPYFSSDDLQHTNSNRIQQSDKDDKFNTIYKDLSWIADTGKQDNTGLAIVGMMAYIASLWLVCMTAKIESLEIYKPQDILKMSVGKWIIPHTISDDAKTVSGIASVNKNIYDLYEKEFTGISDVVVAQLSNAYSSSAPSGQTTKYLKSTTPTLSEDGKQRLKQAFQYISMLPDMYRRHTGHSFHLYEKQAISNSGDPIVARENQLRNIDLINTSHAFIEDPDTNTISQNMFMFDLLANNKAKDTFVVTKNEPNHKDNTTIPICQQSLIHRYASLAQKTRLLSSEQNVTELVVKQQHALSSQVNAELQTDDTTVRSILSSKNTYVGDTEPINNKFEDGYFMGTEEQTTGIQYYPDTDGTKKFLAEDRQLATEFQKAHKKFARQKRDDDTDSILNSDITEGFSVTSILYSLLVNNERIVEQQVLSPLKRDSFNIIYTLTKMMESAGTQPTRLLDTGAGFSNLILSGTNNSNVIKELLDSSISMNGVDLWSTFSSSAFELGNLDSLISDE